VSTRNTVTRIETRTRRRTEIERRERDPDPERGAAEDQRETEAVEQRRAMQSHESRKRGLILLLRTTAVSHPVHPLISDKLP